METYHKMPETDARDDPLKWWRQNEGNFPVLSVLAKRYLRISATSCVSEHIFSTSGNICSPLRARLTSHHVDVGVSCKKSATGQEIGHLNCKGAIINLLRISKMF